jgi:hypothetical protein
VPWESIGSVDTGEMPADERWILFCLKQAQNYIEFVCGSPPDDIKLEIMWHDHDLGDYPSLGVWYDFDEPCEYISACENALDVFNDAVSWSALKTHVIECKEAMDDNCEDDDCEDNDCEDDYEDFEEEDIDENP